LFADFREWIMASSKKYYAVMRGFHPGIYTAWYGPAGAEEQVKGYENALFKGFTSREEATRWVQEMESFSRDNKFSGKMASRSSGKAASGTFLKKQETPPGTSADAPGASPLAQTVIYTDGGCKRNPGPGGYGAVILEGRSRRELSSGFRLTTNNRMELMACIAALASLPRPSDVVLHSDSQYVVKGIEKGWAKKWRRNGWMRTNEEPALNADLWAELLDLCARHRVRFVWVRGHAGNRENERCDTLATEAALSREPSEDDGYLKQQKQTDHGSHG